MLYAIDSLMEDAHDLITIGVTTTIKKHGVSQSALADGINVSKGYISELINKKKDKRWNSTLLQQIADFIGIEPLEIYQAALGMNEEQEMLLEAYAEADDGEKYMMMVTAKALLEKYKNHKDKAAEALERATSTDDQEE